MEPDPQSFRIEPEILYSNLSIFTPTHFRMAI